MIAAVAPVLFAVAITLAGFYGAAILRGWRIRRWSWPFGRAKGACRRCTTTFLFVVPHYTPYDITERGTRRAISPLCERCWSDLGDGEARYPFYAALMTEWINAYEAVGKLAEADQVRGAATNVVYALRAGG